MRRVLLVLALAGCASTVRFADRQPLWIDDDTRPIAVPRVRELNDNWVRVRAGVFTPIDNAFGLAPQAEAKNVNSLDEVPDSTWFHDVRRQARREGKPFGPAQVGADPPQVPDVSHGVEIVEGKFEGGSRGFIVNDSKGHRFLFKLDPPGYFGMGTATEVVCARLVGAMGWIVPDLSLVDLRREQLTISDKAQINDHNKKRRFTRADLEKFLKDVPQAPDGRYRFSASAWIGGKIVGPYSFVGRRADDPNDRIPHENRRDLRGYRVVSAWINNVDTIEANSLDTYVGDDGLGHLVHYQQDVGGSFGNYAVGPLTTWMSFESYFDLPRILGGALAFGAYQRPWGAEGLDADRAATIRAWPELGWFEADHFDPQGWSPLWPNPAFTRTTRRDLYWGTKQVLALSADEIRAAIDAGKYRRETAERLFSVLWARREKIAHAWLDEVAPLEDFAFEGDALCFDDLVARHGFEQQPAMYRAEGAATPTLREGARRCTTLVPGDGYHVVTLAVRRANKTAFGRALRVHYVEQRGRRHLVGLER